MSCTIMIRLSRELHARLDAAAERLQRGRNSLIVQALNDDFDRLEPGTGVRYVEEAGAKGPQASTVQIVDKPGVKTPKAEGESPVEPPLGWQE